MIITKMMKVIPEHEKFRRISKCLNCNKNIYLLTRNKYSLTARCPYCKVKQIIRLSKIPNEDKRSERAKLLGHENLLVTNFYLEENFLLKYLKKVKK